ncbi:hypothetical protein pEaSNUABM11_00259 [Erwinia phage pEa_SNUABM_11]|nr:hypothetical protein pEaSNUABM11_00259 [Erwinia phage pEa_SNUABM_11]
MNKIEYIEGQGLFINDQLIPNSDDYQKWRDVHRTYHDGFNLVITNELVLGANLDKLHRGHCFRISSECAGGILKAADFTSGMYAFRQLGILRELSGKHVGQGHPPTVLKPDSIVMVSYFSEDGDPLAFNIFWGFFND